MDSPQAVIFEWMSVLDELTYYELFRIERAATPDEVRAAFHEFCDAFHPDRHAARGDEERAALSAIFKRGTEGYLVLSDDVLRSHYDAQLASQPGAPPRLSLSPLSRPPRSSRAPGAAPLEDAVRSPSARPFARRAEELIRKGDLRQAKLQLVMANHMDPGNESLEAALRELDAKLR
jgi:curved DNA-binding protein CbpA